jgi:hypothetical protein
MQVHEFMFMLKDSYIIIHKVNYEIDLLQETVGEFLIKTFGEFFGHQQLMILIEIIQ